MAALVRWLRQRSISRQIGRSESEIETHQIEDWQLDAFNRQWQGVSRRVPHWRALKQDRHLPTEFGSWDEVRGSLPLTERTDLQTRLDDLCDPKYPCDQWRSTGGSTGRPVKLPVSRQEIKSATQDMWRARSWFDISPADRAFLIWGHSHLLGSGISGWLRGQQRVFQDWLLGYYRWSAYQISDDDLRLAADRLLRFRPRWLMGYSVALDCFARVNCHRVAELSKLRLKAVIATGESFPQSDSRTRLENLFGCPIVMEYGAVETGPIAHERSGGGFEAFWKNYFVEALPSATVSNAYELVLTSLFPRCVPLLRYRIGDLIKLDSVPHQLSVVRFREVIGRCNDTLILPNGNQVHSEAVAHVLRLTPVTSFQFVQLSTTNLKLLYTSEQPLSDEQLKVLRSRLQLVHPALTKASVELVAKLEQTIAGKTKVVKRAAPRA